MNIQQSSPKLPKVVIDARMVGPVLHGVARYVSQIAKGLAELSEKGPLPYRPVWMLAPGIRPMHEMEKMECIEVNAPFLDPSELWEIPKVLRQVGAALYHSTSFSSLAWSPCPWVVTVHDLNHLHYGSLSKKLYYRMLLKRFVRHAGAVMTVSQFSRREISAWAHVSPGSIEMACNAIEPTLLTPPPAEEIEKILRKYGLHRDKYFLCLGNPKPHKNIQLLVQAYDYYRKQVGGEAWPLVLCMDEFGPSPKPAGVLTVGSCPEQETRGLLSASGALFSPSLYEGFGLPPVEAAAMGVPVVVSQIPPHQEGLSTLATEVTWVDPLDFRGWVSAFESAQKGPRKLPSVAGRNRLITQFCPFRLGCDVDRAYRRVLNHL